MAKSPAGATAAQIQTVRLELSRFQREQCDAAVQFHCIAIDLNLAAALDGRTDPSFREILGTNVESLAEAVCNARHGTSVTK
jgi:hypothetical protein